MTGRGVDQILPTPGDPQLYESFVGDARRYVELAEERNGRITRPVSYSYIWGDALDELRRIDPDARIINLETSITESGDWWRGKGINYRMHPDNVPCLTAASIDCCVLANNHVLDWGYSGLEDTLLSLHRAGLKTAGAGHDVRQAGMPAVMELEGAGRVLVFSYGSRTSGISGEWAASAEKPGVSMIADHPADDAERIARAVTAFKRPGDIVVASIHWGSNWGYTIPSEQRELAHLLIERAGVDVVHGHSSHHPKGIETHAGKCILYGCGDLLNDYEGIPGNEQYRAELSLMYFVTVDMSAGQLVGIRMVPMKIQRLSLVRASPSEALWLKDLLSRECHRLGTEIGLTADLALTLSEPPAPAPG